MPKTVCFAWWDFFRSVRKSPTRPIKKKSPRKTSVKKTTLVVQGRRIVVERKSMKSLRMRIRTQDATIVVSAPQRTKDETIIRFVVRHDAWLQKHLALVQRKMKKQSLVRDLSGVCLWGKIYPLICQRCNVSRAHVVWDGTTLQMRVPQSYTDRDIYVLRQTWQRTQLMQRIREKANLLESTVGVKAQQWRIKNMKTKWGTCNIVARRIWIAQSLVRYPKICLESVMVHELVHFWERYHNARFYALMDQFYPAWRRAQRYLQSA